MAKTAPPVKRSPATRARRAELQRRTLRRRADRQVEEYLRARGVQDPSALRTREGYSVTVEDDTTVGIGFEANGNELVYVVGTEVITLPSDPELVVPLQRELLDINAVAWGPARLAIVGDAVWVVAVDLVDLLPDDDFGRYVDAVMAWASRARPLLSRKYCRTTRKRTAR